MDNSHILLNSHKSFAYINANYPGSTVSSIWWLLIKIAWGNFDTNTYLINILIFQQEKLNVEDLQRALHAAKKRYKGALARLEEISNSVHEKRRKHIDLPPRTPGVGAECSTSTCDLPSLNLGWCLHLLCVKSFSDVFINKMYGRNSFNRRTTELNS